MPSTSRCAACSLLLLASTAAQFVNPDGYSPESSSAIDFSENYSNDNYEDDTSSDFDYDQSAYEDTQTVAQYPDMGGTSTVTQVSDSSLPDSKVTVVACLGDSITQGYRSNDGNSYPEALQNLLGNSYEVYNLGVGGTTVGQSDEDGEWSSDLMYSQTSEFNEALAISPDIVVIMLGTNDAKTAPPRHSWEQKETGFITNFNSIIDAVKRLPSQPVVFIALPPPLYVDGNFAMDGAVINRALPSLLRSIQQSNDLPPVIDTFSALGGSSMSHPELMTMVDPGDGYTADGCHPNDNGYAQVAQTVYNAIEDAIESAGALDQSGNDNLFSHGGSKTAAAAMNASSERNKKASENSGGFGMVLIGIGAVGLAVGGYLMFARGKEGATKTKTRRTPGASGPAAQANGQRPTPWAAPKGTKQKRAAEKPRRQHNSDNVSVM
jgi:alpha-L-fucosidase 2